MSKAILLGLLLVMTFACSSESEEPAIEIRIPLNSININELEKDLREFGRKNDLVVFENDRVQLKEHNRGFPAVSFWFSLSDDKRTAINALTVGQGDFMRVMFFEQGFGSKDQMKRYESLFMQKFGSL